MENKLLNKYLLPYYICAVSFMGITCTSTFFAMQETQMAQKNSENRNIVQGCNSTYFLCLLIAVFSLFMSVFCGEKQPRFVREKAKIMTKHYLQDIFTRHPEMKQYRSILENSKKLDEIAAVICNGLTENERKEILNFVKEESNKPEPKQGISKIQKIEYMIIDVIQAHAAKDPEYMNRILLAIANAQKSNITAPVQKVR